MTPKPVLLLVAAAVCALLPTAQTAPTARVAVPRITFPSTPGDQTASPRVARADALPTLSIVPALQRVTQGGVFNATIVISDVEHLGAFDVTITYNPSLLQAETTAVGPFLGSTGRTTRVPASAPLIDNAAGRIRY